MCTVYLYNIYTCANTKYDAFFKKNCKTIPVAHQGIICGALCILPVAHLSNYQWRTTDKCYQWRTSASLVAHH